MNKTSTLLKKLMLLLVAMTSFFSLNNFSLSTITYEDYGYKGFTYSPFYYIMNIGSEEASSEAFAVSFLCVVSLLFAIASIVTAIVNLFIKSRRFICDILVIACSSTSLLWFFVASLTEAISIDYGIDVTLSSNILLPVFIFIVAFLAYLVTALHCRKEIYFDYASDDNVVPKKVTRKLNANEQQSTIYYISQYKSLLDSGALTQEEFEAKKRELLGL